MNGRTAWWAIGAVVAVAASRASGYEEAFVKTPVGEVQVKRIPPSTILQTADQGSYFDRSNDLFMRLFRYIQKNEVKMTVPVEAGITNATMAFYVGKTDSGKTLADDGAVKVLTTPERTVASLGGRGSYSRTNVEEAVKKLRAWLAQNPRYRFAGEPYAVYWNGPFTPGFMKRFEVHVPVSEASP